MSMWTWPWPRPSADAGGAAATREYVDDRITAPQTTRSELTRARERIIELEQELVDERVAYGTLSDDAVWLESRRTEEAQRARKFARMYGRASATIGGLRAELARERADVAIQRQRADGWRDRYYDIAPGERHYGDMPEPPAPSAWASVRPIDQRGADEPSHPFTPDYTSADVAQVGDLMPENWLNRATATCVAFSRDDLFACTRDQGHHGQHVATAGREVCAVWPNSEDSRCGCGWVGYSHARHVAEQLAAVGALVNSQLSVESSTAPPVLVDRDGDEWLPLADGRYVYYDLAPAAREELGDRYPLYAPFTEKAPGPAPRPTPRTGSFTTGTARGLTGEA